jgi:hypothetical protein
MDNANSELLVRMPRKHMARVGFDGFHAGNAPEYPEPASCHRVRAVDDRKLTTGN